MCVEEKKKRVKKKKKKEKCIWMKPNKIMGKNKIKNNKKLKLKNVSTIFLQ